MRVTEIAQGTKLKSGSIRRIAVTMDERLFFELKTAAIRNERSISAEVIYRLRLVAEGVSE
jgi:hypothetical protein